MSHCFLLVTLYALTFNLLGVEVSFGGSIEFGYTERSLYRIVYGILAYLLFLTLLPVAVLQRRLFAYSGYGTVDSFVFALQVIGHASVIGITFAAGGWLVSGSGSIAFFLSHSSTCSGR